MKNRLFRLLTPQDVEVRMNNAKNGYADLLVYKNARTDMDILDDTFGVMGWQCSYSEVNGVVYCTISVYDEEKKIWISKSDCGAETNVEAEKGQASDAFKRAAFRFGLGRALYSCPKIRVQLYEGEGYWTKFNVETLEYDEDDKCSKLVITDAFGRVRFSWEKGETKVRTFNVQQPQPHPQPRKTNPQPSTNRIDKEKFKQLVIEAQQTGKYNTERLRAFYSFYTSPDRDDPTKSKLETFKNFDFNQKLNSWKDILL